MKISTSNLAIILPLLVLGVTLSHGQQVSAQTNYTQQFTLGTYADFLPFDVAIYRASQTEYTAYATDGGLNRVWQFNGISPFGPFRGANIVVWAFPFEGVISGIAVDQSKDHVYVLETINTVPGASETLVRVFDHLGNLLMTVDSALQKGSGIDVDGQGNVYVADQHLGAVVKLPTDAFVAANYDDTTTQWVGWTGLFANSAWDGVLDCSVDTEDRVHVTSPSGFYHVYAPDGNLWPFEFGIYIQGQRGVDAKLPFGIGPGYDVIYERWITREQSVYSWSWFAASSYSVDGVSDAQGCESAIYHWFGLEFQRVFVCSPGSNTIVVYGN